MNDINPWRLKAVRSLGLAVGPLIMFAASSHGATEFEPNNTIATATLVPVLPSGIGGSITAAMLNPADVDFFQMTFSAPTAFFAALIGDPVIPPVDFAAIGLFSSDGTLLEFAQGPLLVQFPVVTMEIPAGTFYLGVTGAGDAGFLGLHVESFSYQLITSYFPVPAPSALPLLGLAGVLGHRRRR